MIFDSYEDISAFIRTVRQVVPKCPHGGHSCTVLRDGDRAVNETQTSLLSLSSLEAKHRRLHILKMDGDTVHARAEVLTAILHSKSVLLKTLQPCVTIDIETDAFVTKLSRAQEQPEKAGGNTDPSSHRAGLRPGSHLWAHSKWRADLPSTAGGAGKRLLQFDKMVLFCSRNGFNGVAGGRKEVRAAREKDIRQK